MKKWGQITPRHQTKNLKFYPPSPTIVINRTLHIHLLALFLRTTLTPEDNFADFVIDLHSFNPMYKSVDLFLLYGSNFTPKNSNITHTGTESIYSVVTDLAKFLGKSTSNPFLTAKW